MNKARALIVSLAVMAALLLAPAANASVPYSWYCYKTGLRPIQVFTPSAVGYWVGYRGYNCVGGYWDNV